MKLIDYIKKRSQSSIKKDSDTFINQVIGLMPDYVRKNSEYVKLEKNSILLRKNDEVDHAIIIISGEVTVVNEFESGKVYEPVIISHSDFLAVVEIILGMNEIIHTNVCNTELEYIKVPKKEFSKWLNENHEITKIVLNSICFNFKNNMKESGENILLNSMYILVSYLLNCTSIQSKHNTFILKETREKTAIRTGINLRTLYRHIKHLKKENYISITHRNITYTLDQKNRLTSFSIQLRKN